MNYQIIKDKQQLLNFINWLPDLKENEKFYCCLFARKKYAPNSFLKSDKAQLKRFLTDKDRMFDKIKHLEIEKGAYKIHGESVPEESLAMYINPNPRDLKAATYKGIIKLTESLQKGLTHLNPHSEILSCIQRSTSRKVFLDFDIDQKPFDLAQLNSIINPEAIDVLETHGGYHLLIKPKEVSPEFKAHFFKNITALGVDQIGDQLLPTPGCTQGGFIPTFI